jgi:SAM-dependent methyltransferase
LWYTFVMSASEPLEHVACALCGVSEFRPFVTKFGLTLVRCRRCALVLASPRLPPSVTAGRYSHAYFVNEYLPAVEPPREADLAEFLHLRYGPLLALAGAHNAGGSLLEIGIGAGFFLKAASLAGWHAFGVEFSAAAVRYARQELGLRVARAAADHLPFPDASFDAVTLFDVIEHLHDPLASMREVHRCLRRPGTVLISTPNLRALSRYALGDSWAVLSPAEHLYYFTERTLRDLLIKAGFSSVKSIRRNVAAGHRETMNARYTHAPREARARVYLRLVQLLGPGLFRLVQLAGASDAVLMVGRKG